MPDIAVCRRALEQIYANTTTGKTVTGETIWGYQITKNYCADWLFLSPGLCVDPNAAAGSTTLNPALGLRVYNEVVLSNGIWIAAAGAATLAHTRPVWTMPGWVETYIPWIGRDVNVFVEIYTAGGVTPSDGSFLEFALAPYVEGDEGVAYNR